MESNISFAHDFTLWIERRSNFQIKLVIIFKQMTLKARDSVGDLDRYAMRSTAKEHNSEIPLIVHQLKHSNEVAITLRDVYSTLDSGKARRPIYDFLQRESKRGVVDNRFSLCHHLTELLKRHEDNICDTAIAALTVERVSLPIDQICHPTTTTNHLNYMQ